MKRGMLVLCAIAWSALPATGQTVDCSKFHHDDDRSWTAIEQAKITSSDGRAYTVNKDTKIKPGRNFGTINLAVLLDQQCRQ